MVMTHKFFVLFISNPVIDQNQAIAVFDQQTTHRPGAEVVFIGRNEFLPNGFGYYAKHGATIKFKKAGIYGMEFHFVAL
jgi:hypothetical protein